MPRKLVKKAESEEQDELVRYEVGYHLVPLISEEALPAEVGTIREVLERASGIVTADQFPTARPLAYPMSRMTNGKRETFAQSYFGWMQFELPASAIEGVKAELDTNVRILRLLIVRTKREAPSTSRIASIVQPVAAEMPMTDEAMMTPVIPTRSLSDEELDKTIEELVID